MKIQEIAIGKEYWLGEVIAMHHIGEYDFVEYRPDHGEVPVCFSIFYQGQSIGKSAYTLESAMAHAIAWKFDGYNSQAGTFFMRMVGSTPHQNYQTVQGGDA